MSSPNNLTSPALDYNDLRSGTDGVMAFFPGSHADDVDDGHDHHEGGHHKSQFFYNPPKLNCNVILDRSGELEEAPRRLFCCCSFKLGRPLVHRYQPVDAGHDWFAIFFDLVFVVSGSDHSVGSDFSYA
jgi:hypothetical protein